MPNDFPKDESRDLPNTNSARRLEKYKKSTNPASSLIGKRLSPSRTYLRRSPSASTNLKNSETYNRSDKHPLIKMLGNNCYILYDKANLKNGAKAHVGSYGNFMQMLGDKFEPSEEKIKTSLGNPIVYNTLLHYKNSLCQYIADQIEHDNIFYIKVGHYNEFPCLMVCIDKQSIIKSAQTKDPSDAAFESWVNFLASYLIGLTNYTAYKNNFPIEIERRSGFGFITPAVAPTGNSIRINIGLVPRQYADILVSCLKTINILLREMKNNATPLPAMPKNVFYRSKSHLKYLNNRPLPPLKNLLQLLFTPVEKNGKTTVQNIMRTAYARDSIAMVVFKRLIKNNNFKDAFFSGLEWSVKQIEIKGEKTLSFSQEQAINYDHKFKRSEKKITDTNFWQVIKLIIDRTKAMQDSIYNNAIKGLDNCYNKRLVNNIHYWLELVPELIFAKAVQTAEDGVYGNGGSDSEEECNINNQSLYAKKIIVHNGMRAIWSSLIAAAKYLNNAILPCRVYTGNAYYEVTLGLPLIKKLDHLPQIMKVNKISEANVIIHDLNACVTTGVLSKIILKDNFEHEILILDNTIADTNIVYQNLKFFAKSKQTKFVFLVYSGLKNQQLDANKNQYGTVRIFTKDKRIRDTIYSMIKNHEPPLLSRTSHQFRRLMKLFGSVPTNHSLSHKNDMPNTNLKFSYTDPQKKGNGHTFYNDRQTLGSYKFST